MSSTRAVRRGLPGLKACLVLFAAVTVGSIHAQPQQTSVRPTVQPFNASGIYKRGEKAGWTITPVTGSSVTKVAYTVKKNNQTVVRSGELDLSAGKATIEVAVDEPAMIYLEVGPAGERPAAFGAAVDPTHLRPVSPRPKDFDAFWRGKIAGLKAIPENPVVTPAESGKPDVDYATIRMDHVNGTHVYGQLAKPSKHGKYPALLLLQWASPPYPLQRPWVTDRAAEGWLVLNIEPHDVLPTEPASYYQGLPPVLRSYQAIGQDDREKSYFVEMYLRDYRAVDYLSHHPEWDGKTLVVMGTSMGGQQSLAVAGLHPKVTHLIVNEPAGCDLNAQLYGRQAGYPFFPGNDPKVMETARYVDCINFASHIRATSLVAMGFVDTVAPPAGIWTAFNQIRGRKEAAPMVDSPHNNSATPEQQRPFTARAAEWLRILVSGGKIDVKSGVQDR
ncbi:acetylxylan esterase [Fimbriimonas ginsengisoli]|uniref:Acetyl xylan esterase n=1 Tax=Fimbriimonas ginsengisoli Gsoil 348 TaxID=661478 RepID=A0A068NVU0_FIMGI|nr:acetylxylan esterase [Fimbriimonas ginsengisoli]AIE87482.1 Acetyl xylan esterase [Fimbriimonas ginsengisoli Gsoil 348]